MPTGGVSGTPATSSTNYEFADLQTDLQFYLGETTFSTWTQAQQQRQINLAYKDVCNASHWKFTESTIRDSTSANTQEYALPSDIVGRPYEVRWLSLSSQWLKLIPIDFRELEVFDQTSTGNPIYYYIWQGNLGLYPIPDATRTNNIQIRYKYLPPDMSQDSDEPIVPIPFRHAIPMRAAVRCFTRTKDLDMVQIHQAQYNEILGTMLRQLPRVEREQEVELILDIGSVEQPLRGLSN